MSETVTLEIVTLEDIVLHNFVGKSYRVEAFLQDFLGETARYIAEISVVTKSGRAIGQGILNITASLLGDITVYRNGRDYCGTFHVDELVNSTYPNTLAIVYEPQLDGTASVVSVNENTRLVEVSEESPAISAADLSVASSSLAAGHVPPKSAADIPPAKPASAQPVYTTRQDGMITFFCNIADVTRTILRQKKIEPHIITNAFKNTTQKGFLIYSIQRSTSRSTIYFQRHVLVPRDALALLEPLLSSLKLEYTDFSAVSAEYIDDYYTIHGLKKDCYPSFSFEGNTYYPTHLMKPVKTPAKKRIKRDPAGTLEYVIEHSTEPGVDIIKDVAVLDRANLIARDFTQERATKAVSLARKHGLATYKDERVRILIPKGFEKRLHYSLSLDDSAFVDLSVISADNLCAYIASHQGTVSTTLPALSIKGVNYYPQSVVDAYLSNPSVSHHTKYSPSLKDYIILSEYCAKAKGEIQETTQGRVYVVGERHVPLFPNGRIVKYGDIFDILTPSHLTWYASHTHQQAGRSLLLTRTDIRSLRFDNGQNHSKGRKGIKLNVSSETANQALMCILDHCPKYSAQAPAP